MPARLLLPIAVAVALAGCQPAVRSTTITISGPSDAVAAFVTAQTARHPDLVVERTMQGVDRSRVVLTAPDSVSGDEVAEIGRQAIAARLNTKLGD